MTRVALALLLVSSAAQASSRTEIHYVMGTYLRISAEGEGAPVAMRRCFSAARRLDGIFSRFDPASELSRVNAGAGAPAEVSPDFALLLARALALGGRTDGVFDVTVGPLTALWRGPTPPGDGDLAAALARVGGDRVSLRGARLLLPRGTELDFDGIAKGFAVDRCAGLLRRAGVRRALVSFGESSVFALGGPWKLALRGQNPDVAVGVLQLQDQAASVSASRRPDVGGGRPHIVDPRTGTALGEDAVGLVVAASATDAEAYSKALLLWGASGRARIEALGAAGAVYLTPRRVLPGPRATRAKLFRSLARPRPLPVDDVALR